MAAAFNVWGEDAVRNGFRYFFFHNHDVEFTLVNGRPLFDILLEETDPRYVKFEIDLGWMSVAGEDPYEYIRRDPSRFPMFHVKDIRWDPNGPRVAADGTANAGRRFFFVDPGKGVIDWPRIFSALRDPGRHYFFVSTTTPSTTRPQTPPRPDPATPPARPTPPGPATSTSPPWTSPGVDADNRSPHAHTAHAGSREAGHVPRCDAAQCCLRLDASVSKSPADDRFGR